MKNSVIITLGGCLLAVIMAAPAMAQNISPLGSSTQSCLTFEDVLNLSAQRDPGVIIAKAQESEADSEIKQAKSLFRPQLSAFGRSGFGDTGVVDSTISNQIGLRVSQRVFDFGDSKYARQAATSGFEASLEDTRQAKLQAAQRTRFSYWNWSKPKSKLSLRVGAAIIFRSNYLLWIICSAEVQQRAQSAPLLRRN